MYQKHFHFLDYPPVWKNISLWIESIIQSVDKLSHNPNPNPNPNPNHNPNPPITNYDHVTCIYNNFSLNNKKFDGFC